MLSDRNETVMRRDRYVTRPELNGALNRIEDNQIRFQSALDTKLDGIYERVNGLCVMVAQVHERTASDKAQIYDVCQTMDHVSEMVSNHQSWFDTQRRLWSGLRIIAATVAGLVTIAGVTVGILVAVHVL